MERTRVRPADPGLRVPMPPDGEPLAYAREGVEVDLDAFVRRRLDDGDLVRVDPRQEPEKSAPAGAAPTPAKAK